MSASTSRFKLTHYAFAYWLVRIAKAPEQDVCYSYAVQHRPSAAPLAKRYIIYPCHNVLIQNPRRRSYPGPKTPFSFILELNPEHPNVDDRSGREIRSKLRICAFLYETSGAGSRTLS